MKIVNRLLQFSIIVLPCLVYGQTLRNKYVTVLYSTWADLWYPGDGVFWLQPDCYAANSWPAGDGTYHWWGRPAYAGGNLGAYRFMLDGNPVNPNNTLIDRHADQLMDASVDFISIDMTNGPISQIMNAAEAVCRRYKQRFDANLSTPKVAFFVNDASTTAAVKQRFYSGAFDGIFFTFGGKPLLLVRDTSSDPVFDSFTVRKTWGLLGDNTASQWTFKENRSSVPTYRSNNWPEQRSAAVACQETYMTTPGPNRRGRAGGSFFIENWNVARSHSPTFIFVTSWNEWGAQKGRYDPNGPNTNDNVAFVDSFLTEYSPDIEPMLGGHGDQYLIWLRDYARASKETAPNFAIRNANTGEWHFKYYNTERDPAVEAANYTKSITWAAGAHYQSFTGDFNGDGFIDIGLRDTTNGTIHIAHRNPSFPGFFNDNNVTWPQAIGAHYKIVAADFNGDGICDFVLRDAANGVWYLRIAQGAYNFPTQHMFAWKVGSNFEPLAADFNADGKIDLALRDTNTGEVHFATGSGDGVTYTESASVITWAGGTHFKGFAGDFQADGKGDLALFDTNTGVIYLTGGWGNLQTFLNNDNVTFRPGSEYTVHAFWGR